MNKPINVGDFVTYTGRGADPTEKVEYRGYHLSPEGDSMARCIFRPANGSWYEMSVKADTILKEETDVPVPSDSVQC